MHAITAKRIHAITVCECVFCKRTYIPAYALSKAALAMDIELKCPKCKTRSIIARMEEK